MYYAGIDYHKRYSIVSIQNAQGSIVRGGRPGGRPGGKTGGEDRGKTGVRRGIKRLGVEFVGPDRV